MHYTSVPNVASLKYGREMEEKARQFYFNAVKNKHENFKVKTTGLHIHIDTPHLGASPDGIISCDCHEEGLLEIKCPYNYRHGLSGWKCDKDFPVDEYGIIKKKHKYYTQMQGQMMILNKQYCDFFIWTPLEDEENYLLIKCPRDDHFINEMKVKLNSYFFEFVLSEVVTRKNDVCFDNKQKNYCICNRPCFEPMIACDKPGCAIEWYHYSCVNVTRAPKGKWICANCLK